MAVRRPGPHQVLGTLLVSSSDSTGTPTGPRLGVAANTTPSGSACDLGSYLSMALGSSVASAHTHMGWGTKAAALRPSLPRPEAIPVQPTCTWIPATASTQLFQPFWSLLLLQLHMNLPLTQAVLSQVPWPAWRTDPARQSHSRGVSGHMWTCWRFWGDRRGHCRSKDPEGSRAFTGGSRDAIPSG